MGRKREYLKDFSAKEEGGYEYTGSHMVCGLTPEDYGPRLVRALAASVPAIVSLFAAGCMTGTGMEGHAFMLLPYAGTLIMTMLAAWALVQMLRAGPVLRTYKYERTAARLPMRTALGTAFAAAGLCGAAIAKLRGTYTGRPAGTAVFLLSLILSAAAHLYIRSVIRNLHFSATGTGTSG